MNNNVNNRRIRSAECVHLLNNFDQTLSWCFEQHEVVFISRKFEVEISNFGGKKEKLYPQTEILCYHVDNDKSISIP